MKHGNLPTDKMDFLECGNSRGKKKKKKKENKYLKALCPWQTF